MQIVYAPKSNAFVYRGFLNGDEMKLAASCPQARQLPSGEVVIPNDHLLLQKLARHNIPVGMPMIDYDWPSNKTTIPRPTFAQRAMSNFLLLHPRSFNLSEMRTGKTNGALWAADYIMRKAENKGETCKCLIVCQLSTTVRTWRDAVDEHLIGRRTCTVLTGPAERRLRHLGDNCDFYIVNYEGLAVGAGTRKSALELGGFSKAISERDDIQIVVIDESSAYRHPKTIRSRVARLMFPEKKYLWLLTGTPTPTAPTDAYGQAKILNNARGESYTSFKNRTMMQVSRFTWRPKREAARIVAELLQPAIRFKQSDCFDAPQCVTMKRDCEMSAEQARLWREMKRQLTLTLRDKDISAVNEAALRLKLLQIVTGAVYDDEHGAHYVDASPRFSVLQEIIEEAPKKIIVFAPFTSVLDAITLYLTRLKQSHVLVDGRVTGNARDERLREFMAEDGPRILVAHPGPVARGLDLTSAATVVWFGPTDHNEDYMQACERINGPRQKNMMTIVEIAATGLEREIYTRLRVGRTLQGSILKLLEE